MILDTKVTIKRKATTLIAIVSCVSYQELIRRGFIKSYEKLMCESKLRNFMFVILIFIFVPVRLKQFSLNIGHIHEISHRWPVK